MTNLDNNNKYYTEYYDKNTYFKGTFHFDIKPLKCQVMNF